MFGPIRTIVFDFDGTLVNTMPSVIRGLKYAIQSSTGRDIPVDELEKTFGAPPLVILNHWVGPELVLAAGKAWLDFEMGLDPSDIAPFEGVPEMLSTLHKRGVQMAILTGRDRASTLRILNAHKWFGGIFEESRVIAGDDPFAAKPSSAGLLELIRRLGAAPESTLMVGDHDYDMQAGRAAGTKTGAVLWDLPRGQGTFRSRFRAAWQRWTRQDCDVRLATPASLAEWVARHS